MASLYNQNYFHRDLSWLRFNHRVLQEAGDQRNPLYDRIKFLAIFSSNLDEFFKVRVSDIRQARNIEKKLRKKLITQPNKVLKEIKSQVYEQQEAFGSIFRNQIIPDLKREGIRLINTTAFEARHKEISKTYFEEHILPVLTLSQSPDNSGTLYIENEALYLMALKDDTEFITIQIPDNLPRFFSFPEVDGFHDITFIEDLMKWHLPQYFQSENSLNFYALKISKDAELYIEDELSGDLMDQIKNALPRRNSGQATRVLIDKHAPDTLVGRLKEKLDINQTDIVLGGANHNFKDFFGFPNPTEKPLSEPSLPPLPHPWLEEYSTIFDAIRKKDRLLHYPYQSFEPLNKLLETAADDPKVSSLKISLYRVAKKSRLNDAIVRACQNGKKVTVFVEVKARFDEDNNINWGRTFEKHGANVIYSYPSIKVHSKILVIKREEAQGAQRYCYIGTGNFNEKTSKIYTDFGLLTADSKITQDINNVFLILERKLIYPKSKLLLISPFTSRSTFIELVENEIAFANSGKKGHIILKLNSLEDRKMIKMLYKASNAGVQVDLIVRGICCLVPGIKGQSEHIKVISVVDRFLEHSRVYWFNNDGDEKLFIGSADWMGRNLDHRIEVITPILDPDHFKTIKDLVVLQLNDTVKARVIDEHQKNNYVSSQNSDQPSVRSQMATYDYFLKKS